MADLTLNLTEDQEVARQWLAVRDGVAVADVPAQWAAAGAGAAIADLQARLGALKGLAPAVLDDVRRLLLGQPTSKESALLAQVADLQKQLAQQGGAAQAVTAPAAA